MNMNLATPWGDNCSPPQTPYLSFYSHQAEDLMFFTDETIELHCQAALRSVNLHWTLHGNMITTPFRQGVAEARPGNRFVIKVDTTDLLPGFYDLRVELDTGRSNQDEAWLTKRPVTGSCTFGWKADQMAIADTRPADFKEFWDQAKSELDAIACDAHEGVMQTFGPEEINAYNASSACLPPDYDPEGHVCETVESCKIDIAGPDGKRIYGWLAKPQGEGPFPVMLILPGQGLGARPRPLEHARHGYLALDINIHGFDVDAASYPESIPGYLDQYQYEPASKFYFYNVHLRCIQALSYLLSRPDADSDRAVITGGSQGGRLGIVLAGLDPRIKAVVSTIINIPNLPHKRWVDSCNQNGETGLDLKGAPPVIDDAQSRCFAYYDPMNYAPDVHCPVMMLAGLIDPVSPAFSPWSAYQKLGSSNKTFYAVPGIAHDWSAEFDRRAWRWLDEILT